MEWYAEDEKLALKMISERIGESPNGEWNDWWPDAVLEPTKRKFVTDYNLLLGIPGVTRRPGQSSVTRLGELDQWMSFREMLRNYPPFVSVVGFDGTVAGGIETDWMERLEKACSGYEVSCCRGFGWANKAEGGKRVLSALGLFRIEDVKSSIYVELMDGAQLDNDPDIQIMKILFLHNPGKVNPVGVRRFVDDLRSLIIDVVGYDIMYGHSANCDQKAHPHNSNVDKRFIKWGEMEIVLEGKTTRYRISRLTRYWGLQSFLIFPSPEDIPELAIGVIGSKYKSRLIESSPEAWAQIDAFNDGGS